jgi:hypothetical protein
MQEAAGDGARPAARPLASSWWPAGLLVLLVVLSLALQATSFGDTNRHADETFYFLVGQRMHEGLLPYVDVWDRKPPGLFAIYFLIAGLGASVWTYQIAACIAVAMTGFVIARLVERLSGPRGGSLAGVLYVLVVQPFEGATGQAPDFYNLLIAGAALLVVAETEQGTARGPSWRGWAAMALCGVAITVKQTAVFEGLFLGLWLAAALRRRGLPGWVGRAAGYAAVGAAPSVIFAFAYLLAGHAHEFWYAMVSSNLSRGARPDDEIIRNALGLAARLVLLAPCALLALRPARGRMFLGSWLVAGLAGLLAVPDFAVHHALPLLVPLTVATGTLLDRSALRLPLFTALSLYTLLWSSPDHRENTRRSVQAMDALADLVRRHDGGGGLLVFDGPPLLYALTAKPFLSPLVFPHHLNHQIENDVSHLSTRGEIARIIAANPGAVVMALYPSNDPVNAAARLAVLAYVRENCRFSQGVVVPEGSFDRTTVVFGECRPAPARRTKKPA